ncbi:hypothetical protein BS78_04G104200 [Paspalum vaginatum]|nr:hypothetical protein BS78_04G104200 [Paspalum vaginatum]
MNPHRRQPEPGPQPVRRGADGGSLSCYGIVVAAASLLLFLVLATTVSIAKACALAGAVAVSLGATACVLSRCADRDGAAAAALPTTTTATPMPARAACGRGLVDAAIDALPAFAYAHARPAGKCRGAVAEGGSKSGRRALCAVCLEDVEAGEMVRQLPACGHLFHVECIDMWLHSHATCPLCRSDVAPPPRADAKPAAAADPPDDALPPV